MGAAVGDEGEPVLDEERLREILNELPDVYTLHRRILNELENRLRHWWELRMVQRCHESQADSNKHSGARRPLTLTLPPLRREESQRIADIFLSRRAEFLAFTTYIGHYDRSMSLLEDSCRTSPAFAAIVHQFEVSWNDCGKNVPKLNSLELETLGVC